MEGLHGDLTVADNQIESAFGVRPTPFAAAAQKAIEEMPDIGTE